MALGGDGKGDGYSGVFVGVPLYDVPPRGSNQGKAYGYHGNTWAWGWTANGTTSNAQFGFSVAGAGDLNGDGISDVAIGAPFQPKIPTSNNGTVYVYQGNNGSGLSVAFNGSRTGGGSANLGYSLSSAGDMNGDGFADLLIGAPGVGAGNGGAYGSLGTGGGTGLVGGARISAAGLSGGGLGQAVSLEREVDGEGEP